MTGTERQADIDRDTDRGSPPPPLSLLPPSPLPPPPLLLPPPPSRHHYHVLVWRGFSFLILSHPLHHPFSKNLHILLFFLFFFFLLLPSSSWSSPPALLLFTLCLPPSFCTVDGSVGVRLCPGVGRFDSRSASRSRRSARLLWSRDIMVGNAAPPTGI